MDTLLQAIRDRHSVRRYKDLPLPADAVATLQKAIDETNERANLHIQFIRDEPRVFSGGLAYGTFRGVRNYLVMAGPRAADLDERIGYHGERLVLLAQTLGLNTCWAGLTYRKVAHTYTLRDGEKIACYIALGFGETSGVSHKVKTLFDVSNASTDTPQWFVDGVEAALLAPTAVNQQKFRFDLLPDGTVRASRGFSLVGYTQMDLGIAKCHFEIGAARPVQFV